MSERDWRLFLLDIRESASRVLEYVDSMSREEFLSDSRTVDAVIRNLAIIGEAAKKVPASAGNIRTWNGRKWPDCVIS